jgi:hypothetical protein
MMMLLLLQMLPCLVLVVSGAKLEVDTCIYWWKRV